MSELIFGRRELAGHGYFPAALGVFPFVIWGALRFGQRGSALVTVVLSVLAVWGTTRDLGPFAVDQPLDSMVRWCAFAIVVAVTGMLLAASVAEQRRAQRELRESHADLERLVRARTQELLDANAGLRREMGEGLLPIPNGVYVDLATWEKIPFLYAPETRRMVAQMLPLAVEPQGLSRLGSVLEDELGHELAFAVERGKIAANAAGARAQINMGVIERGLAAQITEGSLNAALAAYSAQIREAAMETLVRAQIAPWLVQSVVFVGGSSLMGMVAREMADLCPQARQDYGEAFTAVVDGLALATQA